jgi:hypothetical protein
MFGISAFAAAPFASLSDVNVIVALTGVQATGATGTVAAPRSFALTGIQATGAVGTVQKELGIVAYGQVGTVSANRSVALTGVSGTGSTGTLIPVHISDSTGVSAAGLLGTPLDFYWTTIDDSETPNWQNVEMNV